MAVFDRVAIREHGADDAAAPNAVVAGRAAVAAAGA